MALAVLAVALAGCGSATQLPAQTMAAPRAHLASGPPAPIAVIVMENEEYGDIVGSAHTPYLNGLARRYALATSSYAIAHPSLPNYLALTGGSTFGISSDCTDCAVHASGLAGQLEAHHVSWKAYMEDMPSPCFTGPSAGEYAQKHDPFIYFTADRGSCRHIVPLTELTSDEHAGALARFVWITPNLCHDMHDCGTAAGDAFLRRIVPPLLGALGRNGLLVVTWDEGSSDNGCCRLASGGHVATILAGPGARPGAHLATPVDHYSVLQLIEDLLGLPRLRAAACVCTPTLRGLLRR